MREHIIYLDLNIYRHIIEKRKNYLEIKKKIEKLKSEGFIFPFSPAHMEEIALIRNLEGEPCSEKESKEAEHIDIISELSDNWELLPGEALPQTIDQVIFLVEQRNHNISEELLAKFKKWKMYWETGVFTEKDLKTKLIPEHPRQCFQRVIKDMGMTHASEENDAYFMGRKNKKSMESNFKEAGVDIRNELPFDELKKMYNINHKTINDVPFFEIFSHEGVKTMLKHSYEENDLDFNHIPKGDELLLNHTFKENIITVTINVLDKCGYYTDRQNDFKKIRSRMHDVTHAIYAASASYFVTDDSRFRNKLNAVYHFLEIPTEIISSEKFVDSI